jgi:hypothetical protein
MKITLLLAALATAAVAEIVNNEVSGTPRTLYDMASILTHPIAPQD